MKGETMTQGKMLLVRHRTARNYAFTLRVFWGENNQYYYEVPISFADFTHMSVGGMESITE